MKGRRTAISLLSIPTAATLHTAATLGLGERKNKREVEHSVVVWLLKSGQTVRRATRRASHLSICPVLFSRGCYVSPPKITKVDFSLTKNSAVHDTLKDNRPSCGDSAIQTSKISAPPWLHKLNTQPFGQHGSGKESHSSHWDCKRYKSLLLTFHWPTLGTSRTDFKEHRTAASVCLEADTDEF